VWLLLVVEAALPGGIWSGLEPRIDGGRICEWTMIPHKLAVLSTLK